jgi:CBS domain-containing protein
MKVDTILKAKGRRVVTVRPESPLTTAIQRLKMERIGALVVSVDGETVLGILSERDIVAGLAEEGTELLGRTVGERMAREVTTCSPEDSIRQVMAKMTQGRFRHLPVVDQGRLCGIISIGDVVKNRLEEIELEATVLRDVYLARS